MSQIVSGIALVGAVFFRTRENPGVDPATASRRSVGLQFIESANKFSIGYSVTIDLLKNLFSPRLLTFSLERVLPGQSQQHSFAAQGIPFGFFLQAVSQVIHEPRL